MLSFLKRFYIVALSGALLMAAGWGWYHLSKHNIPVLIGKILIIAAALLAGFLIGKRVLAALLKKFNRHPFWQQEFISRLDGLFFIIGLLFIIFFFQNEVVSIVYVLLWLPLVFWFFDHILASHPAANAWRKVNYAVGAFSWFICMLQAVCQLAAYHYYILDSNIKFFNIVLFRAIAMTSFWLVGFAVAAWLFWLLPRGTRYVFGVLWSLFFIFNIAFWATNIGILYYSGLYLSPTALEHAAGSLGVVENKLTYVLIVSALGIIGFFVYVCRVVVQAHHQTPRRVWQVYTGLICVFGVLVCFGLSSFKNTPERMVAKSFYQKYFGTEIIVTLSPELQAKLKRFGLDYHPENFLVTEHSHIFNLDWCHHTSSIVSTSSLPCPSLLVPPLQKNTPNLVIIFLESYSARLTGPYNPRFKGVTPGLNAMAADAHTTVFKNYYNASTPTITGILSQMCSFLPPTGHNEIQNDRKLQSHRLLCLPEMLKRFADFKYANYITAVDKEFAHKDGIFTSMGIDKVFGTSELAQLIKGVPLAWGYSDHQMFPVLFSMLEEHKKEEPFFMSLSTVDTHPPFNLAKDEVSYDDGSQQVLNAFHTTDDAFLKFWQEFRSSSFASNTILVAVADHAIFPAALTKDLFPDTTDKLTYYDENAFLMYVPESILPRMVTTVASGIDFAPTMLHLYGINATNTFEGHSIFDDRSKFPNVVGMHELGLYINQTLLPRGRSAAYDVPSALDCPKEISVSSTAPLTLCEFKQVYDWKRRMLEEGRLWKP